MYTFKRCSRSPAADRDGGKRLAPESQRDHRDCTVRDREHDAASFTGYSGHIRHILEDRRLFRAWTKDDYGLADLRSVQSIGSDSTVDQLIARIQECGCGHERGVVVCEI